jgi:hypothetical protein
LHRQSYQSNISKKLLEAIGALTKDEQKAAATISRETAYQDSTTESLSNAADGLATATTDGPDNETSKPATLIGQAVIKVGVWS